jgi:hypothetical protein
MDITTADKLVEIRRLNDAFRTSFHGGEIAFTHSFTELPSMVCAYRGRRPRCPAHGDHVIRSMTTGAAHELDGAVGFIF